MTKFIRDESMRIGGKKIKTDEKINVQYPFTEEIIGTVPAGKSEHAKKAFDIASNYKSKLTRYERQKILQKTAETLVKRKEEISSVDNEKLLFRYFLESFLIIGFNSCPSRSLSL